MRAAVDIDVKKASKFVGEVKKKDDKTADIKSLKFKFTFDKSQIGGVKLPLMFENNISNFIEKIDANMPINFD